MDGNAVSDIGSTDISPGPRAAWRAVFDPGLIALRRLWKPFVAIQLLGLLVVVGYFTHDGFAAWCDGLGRLKASVGIAFPMIGLAVAGGLVPELFKFVTGVDRRLGMKRLELLVYAMLVFASIGLLVDHFYALLAHLLGERPSIGVVLAKVAIDQFLFSPFISLPYMALVFTFQRERYRPRATLRRLGPRWYRDEVGPLLVVCWAYWIPMCVLMYLLPAGLTFLFGMCASAASATILTAVARRDGV